jgi:photosystem II stability/assembly factor-like uncharacterized protein
MMKKTYAFLLFAVLLTGSLMAQYIVKPTYFEPTGVSNAGVVAGYQDWGGPYYLWYPDENEYGPIGGAAPGNGIGGVAKFSSDGNYLSGSNYTDIPVNMDWHKSTLADYNFIFKSIEFPAAGSGFVGYAGGQSLTYNGNGIVLKTNNSGVSWEPMWTDSTSHGIEAMSFPTDVTGYVGGWNQYFAKTTDGGWSWTEMNPAGNDFVYIYTSIAFKDEMNGVVTAQLEGGGTMGVYVTSDGGLTWTHGIGLAGIPSKVTWVSGDIYYLVTSSGQLQKTIDSGLTWTIVHTFPGALLIGVGFYDESIGYVIGETNIYRTLNGGQNWTQQMVGPNVIWRDVAWIDANNVIICGTPDMIYESNNGGDAWTWANQETSTMVPALYDIAIAGTLAHVCGSQGTFYKRSIVSTQTVSVMARYNTVTQEWMNLGSLGYSMDSNMSSGWNISGDGQTVVGNAWANPPTGSGIVQGTHAVAWNATEGIIDLGSLYASENRSTRADAVSYNGDVIAGWQDGNGPWKSAVWRRNPAGGYFPNEYILVNPEGSPTDENNQVAAVQAISGDGVWMGGMSDWTTNGAAWLWSEASGLQIIGSYPDAMAWITGINYDGSRVVGYFDRGFWDPRIPFLWTPATGLLELNNFASQNLGYEMGTSVMYTPMDISPNGQYIAGNGFDPMVGEWGEYQAFRLQLPSTATDEQFPQPDIAVLNNASPNPFNSSTGISFSLSKRADVDLKVYNSKGQFVAGLVNETKQAGNHTATWNGLDKNGKPVSAGVYFYKIKSGSFTSTKKMILIK